MEKKDMEKLLKKIYRLGFADGLKAYAINKNGEQYVGSCGITLKRALKEMENNIYFDDDFKIEKELFDGKK